MKEPEQLRQVDKTHVLLKGRKLSYFSGCDYFRLASHPAIVEAARTAATRFGLSVSASRMTTGNHPLLAETEQALRLFFGAPDALLVPAGYFTNLIVAQALAGTFTHALIDESAHPALKDAAGMLGATILPFKHLQPADVARIIRETPTPARFILLTDGMFSNDGAAAPLREYLQALPASALLLVDDAHGAGVLGKTGRGTLEHCRVPRTRIIQTATLSKSFGAGGGVILASLALRRQIMGKSRLFIGSTPAPLPILAGALAASRLLRRRKSFLTQLHNNATRVKTALRNAGFPVPETPGPIIPIHPRSPSEATHLNRALLQAGILPPFIKYPGGPASGYFRFVISSEHTRPQLDTLLHVLRLHQERFPLVHNR